MSHMIEEYYQQEPGMPAMLLQKKLLAFDRNEDIKREFEYWIENQSYKRESCVVINGYTAERLAEMSEFLDGEGAFCLLIELREHPQRAEARIKRGFNLK